MSFSRSTPHGLAARYVDAFWSSVSSGAATRVLPDGCMDFVFDLEAGRGRVVGCMSRAQSFVSPPGTRLFGVRFLPGVAALFVDAKASDLADTQAALSQLVRGVDGLAERVAEAPHAAARVALVSALLVETSVRLRPGDARLARALDLIAQQHGQVSSAQLTREVGLSERQLERLFHERVGIRPKLFCRVTRFRQLMRLARAAGGAIPQAALARLAGYSDESHLLRECRSLAGVTARQLGLERDVGNVQARAASTR